MKLLPLLLLACALPAAAQLHKCTVDGKVSYSQQPCTQGTATTIAVPDAPPPDPAAASDLQRQKQELKQLETARHKREARAEREDAAAERASSARSKKCGRLQLQQKWAEEDARSGTAQSMERAKQNARRAADSYALECGG